ncbi:MAG: DNA-3-methyladenine glycosylase [Candidatus Thermoplasmatota archaeon]|nr:DNA-3-methyladenine glycosylase [Candidatus Thermoplasmatota archaeon]
MCYKERKLQRDFYLKDTEEVSKSLLGKYLVHDKPEGRTVGKIVETEAYLGNGDPACHASNGERTERTDILFEKGGYAYVYLIYGMYNCFNVVTGEEGKPGSAFIRGLEPIEGKELMRERRGLDDLSGKKRFQLTNGPGKLCMAMDIKKRDKGKDLCGDELYISEPPEEKTLDIVSAERINIDYAGEAKEWPLRFFIKDNPYVSKPP